jgi:MFS family permease
VFFGTALLGAALIGFSFSHWFVVSWILLFGVGFGMMAATASMNTMIQTIVEEDKRARVMSFFAMAFIGMAPLGNLVGGSLAGWIGAPWTVRLAGTLCLLGALWFWRRLPIVREHIRPIYRRLGIIPEVAAGLLLSPFHLGLGVCRPVLDAPPLEMVRTLRVHRFPRPVGPEPVGCFLDRVDVTDPGVDEAGLLPLHGERQGLVLVGRAVLLELVPAGD